REAGVDDDVRTCHLERTRKLHQRERLSEWLAADDRDAVVLARREQRGRGCVDADSLPALAVPRLRDVAAVAADRAALHPQDRSTARADHEVVVPVAADANAPHERRLRFVGEP